MFCSCCENMRIGLITRRGARALWGGDLKALQVIQEGMQALGVETDLIFDFYAIDSYDFLFLSNTCFDLRPSYNALKLQGKRFGLIGFHEDMENISLLKQDSSVISRGA
ncbi:MAG: hypothetical protein LVR00_01945 [Rhabdochlamydiaceae bacterium]